MQDYVPLIHLVDTNVTANQHVLELWPRPLCLAGFILLAGQIHARVYRV